MELSWFPYWKISICSPNFQQTSTSHLTHLSCFRISHYRRCRHLPSSLLSLLLPSFLVTQKRLNRLVSAVHHSGIPPGFLPTSIINCQTSWIRLLGMCGLCVFPAAIFCVRTSFCAAGGAIGNVRMSIFFSVPINCTSQLFGLFQDQWWIGQWVAVDSPRAFAAQYC